MVESGLDSSGPGYGLAAGFCEDGSEHLCRVKGVECLSREH